MSLVLGVVLATAFLHAGWNAVAKSVGDRWVSSLLIGAVYGLAGFAGALVFGFPPAVCFPFIVASALTQCLYMVLLTSSYEYGDMSRLYPVARGVSPLLVTIVAVVFLNEGLSAVAGAGITVVCGAIAVLAFGRGLPRRGQGIGLALATGVAIAGYTLIDGVGVRHSDSALSYASWLFLLQGPMLVGYCCLRGGSGLWGRVGLSWVKGSLGGVLSVVAYTIIVWAQSRAPLAIVSALRETSVVWAALAGRLFLNERLNRKEFAAICLAVIGAAALQLSH